MDVARCFNTKVITTSDAARLPGAEHIGYDHHHTNLSETKELARKILDRALEAHELRKGMPVFIPPYEITAEVGFSPESTVKHYGSFKPLAEALKSGLRNVALHCKSSWAMINHQYGMLANV